MNAQLATRMDGAEAAFGLRDRATRDLLRRLPPIAPRRIANLAGGGDAAEILLARQFPDASIVSLDYASFESDVIKPDVHRFQRRPLRVGGARPAEPFDLIFSSGSLEMPPSFRQLAPDLLALTRPGGWLTFQIPSNLHEPNRQLQRMVAVDGPWAEKLLPIAKTRPFNETVEGLNAILGSVCASVEFWETTYVHRMDSVAAIIESMRATSLAPFLAPLDKELRQQFLKRFAAKLAQAYPTQPDGKVLLRFPRIFLLAQR
jgi:trans-aconitate 2-methyltransferase